MKKSLITFLTALLLFAPILNVQAQNNAEDVYNYFWVNKAANVRAQPGMHGKVIGGVHRDEYVYVLAKHNGWCKIDWKKDQAGYVYCDLLEEDIMPHPFDSNSSYENSYSEDYSSDESASFWEDLDLPTRACNAQIEICSGNYQMSISGYITDKGHERQDLNLHINGSFDLQNLNQEIMSINANGSAGSMTEFIQGGIQAIATTNQTFIKFENMFGGKLLGEFPLAQNIWFLAEEGTSAFSMPRFDSISNSVILQEVFPTSTFIDSSSTNGITEFHYQVPVSLDNLSSFNTFEFASISMADLEELKPHITLDYWVNENNMLTKLLATAHISDPEETSNEAQVEFSLKFAAINQPVSITVPAAADTLPLPDHSLDF